MLTIIAGVRWCSDIAVLEAALAACPWEVDAVLSGCAPGIDTLAIVWGKATLGSEHVRCRPFMEGVGKAGGPLRNQAMAEEAHAGNGGLLAIWDGVIRKPTGGFSGTGDMILQALRLCLPVFIYRIEPEARGL